MASASLGDLGRWIGGAANIGGTNSSPYNANRGSSDGNQAQTTQTGTVVSGNNIAVEKNAGDNNVIGSGISGAPGVDLVATKGAIDVLAGLDTSAIHQDSSSHQIGSLGRDGTATHINSLINRSCGLVCGRKHMHMEHAITGAAEQRAAEMPAWVAIVPLKAASYRSGLRMTGVGSSPEVAERLRAARSSVSFEPLGSASCGHSH